MHIEFLVEEPSAEATLSNLVPKILGQDLSFKIHSYQGKPDLINKLLPRLKGYKTWMPEDWRIVVLIDADDEDCRVLKDRLEGISQSAGLITKSSRTIGSYFQVLNRLAIEELESWFFGDIDAVRSSYPRIPLNLGRRAKYRNPDSIRGGTWEALDREFKKVGYFSSGISKILVAREVSLYMEPERNQSGSFQVFRQGLLDLVG
ncbi:MAG: DUF4276 family protein [Candidatus Zixiibacteriota bacterium]